MPVRENRAQALRQMVLLVRGMFLGWKNRDGTGLIFRLMQRLGKPFFQFVGGGAAFFGGEPSPRNPRRPDSDLLPSLFPRPPGEKHGVRGGETLGPTIRSPSPQRRTENCLRLPLQLYVARMAKHAPF